MAPDQGEKLLPLPGRRLKHCPGATRALPRRALPVARDTDSAQPVGQPSVREALRVTLEQVCTPPGEEQPARHSV
eukprot:11705986-Alexandrium_andersonii.AAC.1